MIFLLIQHILHLSCKSLCISLVGTEPYHLPVENNTLLKKNLDDAPFVAIICKKKCYAENVYKNIITSFVKFIRISYTLAYIFCTNSNLIIIKRYYINSKNSRNIRLRRDFPWPNGFKNLTRAMRIPNQICAWFWNWTTGKWFL